MMEHPEPAVTLRDIVNVLRRHGRWILVGSVLAVVPAVAVLSQMPSLYRGEATVILDLRRSAIPGLPDGAPAQPSTIDPAVVRSEVSLLRSRPVAREVIVELDLESEPEFRKPGKLQVLARTAIEYGDSLGLPASDAAEWLRRELASGDEAGEAEPPIPGDPLEEVINAYQRKLTIGNDGRSYLISVSFMSENPVLAARIINTHVAAYVRSQTDLKRAVGRNAAAWLNDEMETLQTKVRRAEEAVQSFRESNQIVNAKGNTVLTQQIAEINSQLILASAERSSREARLLQARQLTRNGAADQGMDVMNSPLIQRLREQEAGALRREAELRNRLGQRHPDLQTAQAELRDLQDKIGSEIRRILESLSNEVAVVQAKETALGEQLSILEQRSAATEHAEITLRELEREAGASRNLYENLLAQRQLIGVQQGLQQPDVRVVSEATVPMKPSSPKTLQTVVMVMAMFGLLLTGLAFVREFLFRGIKGTADLERVAGVRCIGTIPLIPRRLTRKGNPAEAVVDQPRSRFADAIRSLRGSLPHAAGGQMPRSLLITSALPDEGKSTLSVALGRSLVNSGYRVLLVDADLRCPSVASTLGDRSAEGWLNDILEAGDSDAWPVRTESHSRLSYLACHETDAAPQDLLGSAEMRAVLERAAREFDIVLVDAPPVIAVSDALILSRMVEATLLVACWRRTPKDALALTMSQLAHAGARVVGAALNRVDVERGVFASGDPEAFRRHTDRYYAVAPKPRRLGSRLRSDPHGRQEAA
jgi:capsular exopolysaccharide synthesis family protein